MKIAQAFYTVPGKYSLKELFYAMWILAKEQGYDVFNAMDVMDNHDVYEELNFKLGGGSI